MLGAAEVGDHNEFDFNLDEAFVWNCIDQSWPVNSASPKGIQESSSDLEVSLLVNPSRCSSITPSRVLDWSQVYSLDSVQARSETIPETSLQTQDINVNTEDLTKHLVDLYFEKVQGFLPLFHRPSFYSKYLLVPDGENRVDLDQPYLDDEKAIVLNAMSALSVRYSEHSTFASLDPLERATIYLEKARELFTRESQRVKQTSPSICYLQGAILLAFHSLLAGPSYQGWIETGVCCCIANELGLSWIDADIITEGVSQFSISDVEWLVREEKRHAWWVVWEMDIFISTMFCRPATIDQDHLFVLLPVADTAWFRGERIYSSWFGSERILNWCCLQGSPNHHERNLYLVSSSVFKLLHDTTLDPHMSRQSMEKRLFAAECFLLSLPPRLQVHASDFTFDSVNVQGSNWVICLNLMIQW